MSFFGHYGFRIIKKRHCALLSDKTPKDQGGVSRGRSCLPPDARRGADLLHPPTLLRVRLPVHFVCREALQAAQYSATHRRLWPAQAGKEYTALVAPDRPGH